MPAEVEQFMHNRGKPTLKKDSEQKKPAQSGSGSGSGAAAYPVYGGTNSFSVSNAPTSTASMGAIPPSPKPIASANTAAAIQVPKQTASAAAAAYPQPPTSLTSTATAITPSTRPQTLRSHAPKSESKKTVVVEDTHPWIPALRSILTTANNLSEAQIFALHGAANYLEMQFRTASAAVASQPIGTNIDAEFYADGKDEERLRFQNTGKGGSRKVASFEARETGTQDRHVTPIAFTSHGLADGLREGDTPNDVAKQLLAMLEVLNIDEVLPFDIQVLFDEHRGAINMKRVEALAKFVMERFNQQSSLAMKDHLAVRGLEKEGSKVLAILKDLAQAEYQLAEHNAPVDEKTMPDDSVRLLHSGVSIPNRAKLAAVERLSDDSLREVNEGIFLSFDYRKLDIDIAAPEKKSERLISLYTGESLDRLYDLAARHLTLVFKLCPALQDQYHDDIVNAFLTNVGNEHALSADAMKVFKIKVDENLGKKFLSNNFVNIEEENFATVAREYEEWIKLTEMYLKNHAPTMASAAMVDDPDPTADKLTKLMARTDDTVLSINPKAESEALVAEHKAFIEKAKSAYQHSKIANLAMTLVKANIKSIDSIELAVEAAKSRLTKTQAALIKIAQKAAEKSKVSQSKKSKRKAKIKVSKDDVVLDNQSKLLLAKLEQDILAAEKLAVDFKQEKGKVAHIAKNLRESLIRAQHLFDAGALREMVTQIDKALAKPTVGEITGMLKKLEVQASTTLATCLQDSETTRDKLEAINIEYSTLLDSDNESLLDAKLGNDTYKFTGNDDDLDPYADDDPEDAYRPDAESEISANKRAKLNVVATDLANNSAAMVPDQKHTAKATSSAAATFASLATAAAKPVANLMAAPQTLVQHSGAAVTGMPVLKASTHHLAPTRKPSQLAPTAIASSMLPRAAASQMQVNQLAAAAAPKVAAAATQNSHVELVESLMRSADAENTAASLAKYLASNPDVARLLDQRRNDATVQTPTDQMRSSSFSHK
jgi:hypothetical protein